MKEILFLMVVAGVAGAITRVVKILNTTNQKDFSTYIMLRETLQGLVVGAITYVFLSNKHPLLDAILIGALGGFVGFNLLKKFTKDLFNKEMEEIEETTITDLESIEKIEEKLKKMKEKLERDNEK